MTEEFIGEIVAISPKGRGSVPEGTSILIKSPDYSSWKDSQRWFNLAEAVNPKFVAKGTCEYKMDHNNFITFVKMTGAPSQNTAYKPYNKSWSGKSFQPSSNYTPNPEKDLDIRAQMCVKAAIQVISAANDYALLKNDKDSAIKPTQSKIAEIAAMVDGSVESAKVLIKNQREIFKGGLPDERDNQGNTSDNIPS